MFLSKQSNGFFYLFFDDELGKRHKVSTKCKHKSEAMDFVQRFKVSEQEQKTKLERKLLSQFSEDCRTNTATKYTPKTQANFDTAFNEFLLIIGDKLLQKMDVRDIERFLAAKTEEASVWTARNYYITLASALETAKRWQLIVQNPFRLVEKPRVPEVQPAHFSPGEFQKLMKVITDRDFRDLCIAAVSTGLRFGELSALRWSDIDLTQRIIVVQSTEVFTTKTKKNRSVPMTDQVFGLLLLRNGSQVCEWVFNREGRRLEKDHVSKTFKKYVIAAGLNDRLHFHSLRHTFATWLVQSGVGIYEVQKLMGHSSVAVTQVYAHLAPSELHSAVDKISLSLN